MTRSREFFAAVLLVLSLIAGHVGAADRFYISIPGPTLSYVPLSQDKIRGSFFYRDAQEAVIDDFRRIDGFGDFGERFCFVDGGL